MRGRNALIDLRLALRREDISFFLNVFVSAREQQNAIVKNILNDISVIARHYVLTRQQIYLPSGSMQIPNGYKTQSCRNSHQNRKLLCTGGSRGPWGRAPLPPRFFFFKIMQFLGNFEQILGSGPPSFGVKTLVVPLTKILDPSLLCPHLTSHSWVGSNWLLLLVFYFMNFIGREKCQSD